MTFLLYDFATMHKKPNESETTWQEYLSQDLGKKMLLKTLMETDLNVIRYIKKYIQK